MKIRPLLFVFIAALLLTAYRAELSAMVGRQNAPAAAQNTSAVRILTPQPGEKLQQSAITVRYVIDQPQVVAASTPNFRLHLDGRDPVETTEKESTFTGLAPGNHTLTIEVVDANGTPFQGTHNEIQFTVIPEPAPATAAPSTPPASASSTENSPGNNQTAPPARKQGRKKQQQQSTQPPQASLSHPELMDASLKIGDPDNGRPPQDGNLPETAGALPLLSIIGAGMLIGGMYSAHKTRRAK